MLAKATQDSEVVRGFFLSYDGKDVFLEIDQLCDYKYRPINFKLGDKKKFWSFVLLYVIKSADFKKSEFYKSLTQEDFNKLNGDLITCDKMSNIFDCLDMAKNPEYISKVHNDYPDQIN